MGWILIPAHCHFHDRTGFELSAVLDFVCAHRPGWVADVEHDLLRIHAPYLPTF